MLGEELVDHEVVDARDAKVREEAADVEDDVEHEEHAQRMVVAHAKEGTRRDALDPVIDAISNHVHGDMFDG